LYRVIAYGRGFVDVSGLDMAVYPLRITPLFREGWGYGFDGLMVFGVLAVLAAWYPTRARLEEDEVGATTSSGGEGVRMERFA
jgi:hypothetical protein